MAKTTYFWDPIEDNVAQSESVGGLINFNTYPAEFGQVISLQENNGDRYLHSDGIGSVIVATDENQDLTGSWSYSAFGEETNTSGIHPAALGFCGTWQYVGENNPGMLYTRRRAYNTTLIRWTSGDPRESSEDLNLYMYARNSPPNFVDPLGEDSVQCTCGFTKAVYGSDLKVKATTWKKVIDNCAGPYSACCARACTCVNFEIIHKLIPKPCCEARMWLKVRTPKECCDDAKAQGFDNGDVAGVICCDGRKVACVWISGGASRIRPTDPTAIRIIDECSAEHERIHFPHIDRCEPYIGDLDRLDYRTGVTVDQGECAAYKAEYACLVRKRSQCGTNRLCRVEVDRELAVISVPGASHCGNLNPPIPFP